MPNAAAWKALAREAFDSLHRGDAAHGVRADFRRAADELLTEHQGAIAAERRRWKRGFRRASAVVYGLSKRLAPPRRLVFLGALALILIATLLQMSEGDQPAVFFLYVSIGLLAFLLALELLDKLHFRDELVMARELQAELVPQALPELPGFELGGTTRVANTVGGDLYDFVPLPDGRLAVLFGDASGHGMAAGLVMAVAHTAFRTQLEVDPVPARIAEVLNRQLCRIGESRVSGPRNFFAGVSLLLEGDGSFSAVVAGHPPILRLDASGRLAERLGAGSYPMGVKATTRWESVRGTLAPGETLLLFSDGLPEARNASGEEFGDARVEDALVRLSGASAPALVAGLEADLDAFLARRPAEDDVSIAAIRRRG